MLIVILRMALLLTIFVLVGACQTTKSIRTISAYYHYAPDNLTAGDCTAQFNRYWLTNFELPEPQHPVFKISGLWTGIGPGSGWCAITFVQPLDETGEMVRVHTCVAGSIMANRCLSAIAAFDSEGKFQIARKNAKTDFVSFQLRGDKLVTMWQFFSEHMLGGEFSQVRVPLKQQAAPWPEKSCTTRDIWGDQKSGISFVCSERFNHDMALLSVEPGGYRGGNLYWFMDKKNESIVRIVVKEKTADVPFYLWSKGVANTLMRQYRGKASFHEEPDSDQTWFDLGTKIKSTLGSGQKVTVWRVRPIWFGRPRMVYFVPIRLGKTFVIVWVGSKVIVDDDETAWEALSQIHVKGSILQFGGDESS